MPSLRLADGTDLHFIEAGQGTPIVFVHEFAGDAESWAPQFSSFGRSFRCIAFNARGYPPSAVPLAPAAYGQAHAADDIAGLIMGCGLAPAHVVGLSMGAFASLHLGLRHPHLVRSLALAGIGHGTDDPAGFRAALDAGLVQLQEGGMAAFAEAYLDTPSRHPFRVKDPRGHAEFVARFAQHSLEGTMRTMLGVQRARPVATSLDLSGVRLPTLIIAGDEDQETLAASLHLKGAIAGAALAVLPHTGHTLNLEEPEAFNRLVRDFVTGVDAGLPRYSRANS